MIWSFQLGVSATISNLSSFLSPSTTAGESSPPRSMTLGVSSLALPTRATASEPKPTLRTGKRKRGTSIVEIGERTFDKELARLDDADVVAELFDFAHDVGGEDDSLAVIATFADERGDGAGGHDIEAVGRFVEDHHRGVVNECAGDGGFLHHSGGELVAAAVAETVHVQAFKDILDALFQRGFV